MRRAARMPPVGAYPLGRPPPAGRTHRSAPSKAWLDSVRLHGQDLVQPALVAFLAGERRGHEGRDQFLHDFLANDPCAQTQHVHVVVFDTLMGAMGVGGVVGSLALAALAPRKKRGQIMVGILAVIGLLLIAVSLVTYLDSVVLAFLMIAVLGLGQSWLLPLINATILESTPENMRGRMLGLLSLDRATATLMARAMSPKS